MAYTSTNVENLYRFHHELNRPFRNTRELMSFGLDLIAKFLDLEQVSFFMWDKSESVLDLRLVWREGVCMDIEEDIYVSETSSLRSIFEGNKIYKSKNFYYPAYYFALNWQGYTSRIGLKFSPYQSVRTGVLRLTRFRKNWNFSPKEKELLKLLSNELARKMSFAQLNQFHRDQLTRAQALSKLNSIFASSMRLEDGLKLILKGIQKHFGFDRVKLYLIDKNKKSLSAKISADVLGKAVEIDEEPISLENTKNPMANIMSKSSTNIVLDKNRNTLVYLPLMIKAKKAGLLIVDNLLSQNPILHDDLVSLSSFAGQIALAVDNATLFDRVQELSQYDELTGLAVRRYFMERFRQEFYRAKRFKLPMALIWMDVDNFKPINDSYGHKVGDEILKKISDVIKANLRKIDIPCRYGGDEILIMLPQSDKKSAHTSAMRLLQEIRKIKIPMTAGRKTLLDVTVSQGVSVYPNDAKTIEELMQTADEALYYAKSCGRNNVAMYSKIKKSKE